MKVTFVIPAYNEEKRIASCIETIDAFVKTNAGNSFTILLIVEKSTDQTLKIALNLTQTLSHFHVVDNLVHRGKGYAVKSGMLLAQGDIVFFMDVDLSTSLDHVLPFIDVFHSQPNLDVIIGDRRHQQSIFMQRQGVIRQSMGQTFNHLVCFLVGSDFKDTQCGFKAFRKKVVRPIFEKSIIDGFSFDVEILWLAKKLGFSILAMPVKWKNDRESKVNIVRDSLKMIYELLVVKARSYTF